MNPQNRIRVTLLLSGALMFTCFFLGEVHANRQVPPTSKQKLRVKLSVKKTIFYLGEFIVVRAEVWNEGTTDIFIGKRLNPPSDGTGGLELYLKHGSKLDRAMSRAAADYVPDHKQPLAGIFPKFYIALAPGSFYGQNVSMDTRDFPNLNVPGRYEIKGEYTCGEFFGGGEGNPLLEYASELKALPYKACEGHEWTNSLWIEVRSKK